MDQVRFLEEARAIVGEGVLTTQADECRNYGKDWTSFAEPNPFAVALPRTVDEVSKLLALCSKHDIAVVPSGGRTGLAGGAVACRGELVLSLARLNRMEAVDPTTQTLRVQAGAINLSVQDHCAPFGLFWPVELGSKGSCQVGGNIATNAGGVRVIRYGHARHWVQSLQVVLVSGEIVELNGELVKNNTGYDLRNLLIGSEGTLGVITGATLKLAPVPRDKDVFFFACGGMQDVLNLLRSAREERFPLLAFECLTRACLESVRAQRKIAPPLPTEAPFYVLIDVEKEIAGTNPRLESWLESLFDKNLVLDGTLAQGAAEGRRFWEFREGITESLSQKGLVYKNDLALPLGRLEEFTRALLREAPKWYQGCELYFFGHIGDGNLHVNVVKPAQMDSTAFLVLCEAVNEPLFALIQKLGGSIAAEHGIGLLKKRFLHYSRSESEIRVFKEIKRAFDPRGLLNPGKIFDL